MKKKYRTHIATLEYIQGHASSLNRRYTKEEENLILYSILDDYTLALALMRTVHAIQNKRYHLLHGRSH